MTSNRFLSIVLVFLFIFGTSSIYSDAESQRAQKILKDAYQYISVKDYDYAVKL